jgi:hypothetical protein
MKSYKETIASVFEKGDAILESKRIRARRIIMMTATVSGLCAAAIIGVSALHNRKLNDDSIFPDNPDIIVTESIVDTQVTTTKPVEENTEVHTNSTHKSASSDKNGAKTTITAVADSERVASDTASSATSASVNASASRIKTSLINNGSKTTTAIPGGIITEPDDERSFEMKKLSAFAISFITALSANPMQVSANDNYRLYAQDPFEKQIIAQVAQGETDLNGNGKFDIDDCYKLFVYTDGFIVDDAIKERIELYADYDHDGSVTWFSDALLLLKYYLMTKPLDTSVFNIENYEDPQPNEETQRMHEEMIAEGYDEEIHPPSYYFTKNLMTYMRYYGTGYGFFADMVNSGDISPDVNGDGKFDIKDCVDYEIFVENLVFKDPELYSRYQNLVDGVINWRDGDFYVTFPNVQGGEYWEPFAYDIIQLPEATIKRCADVFSKLGIYGGQFTGRYMAYSYLLDHPLDTEYFLTEYYENFYEGASHYDINAAFVFAARTDENIKYFGDFDKAKFGSDFKKYCQDIKDGKKELPDLNFDGVINSYDYETAMWRARCTFLPDWLDTEGFTDEENELKEKQYKYFKTKCDINGDGKSGDIYDVLLMQCYMLLENDDLFNENANEEFNISEEYNSSFALLNDIDIDRNGDANTDGGMDMGDVVLIMQSQANPDKYELTDKGKFNADLYETGNGITVNDALQVQKELLELG